MSVPSVLTRPIGDWRFLAAFGVACVATFLALFFSAQAGLLVLAAAWLAVGTWRFPWTAFLLLIAVAPFLLIVKATVVIGAVTVLKDVVILALFARVLADGSFRLPRTIAVPTLTLVAWAVVAFLAADSFTLGLLRLRDLLLYVPMLLVAARLVNTPRRAGTFVRVVLGSAVLVLALAALQGIAFADGMVLRFDPGRSVWIHRASSVLAHPNILGGFLVFVLPLAGAVVVQRRFPSYWRAGAWLVALAGLAATYATYSRSGWIAMVAALATGAVVFVAARRPRLVALTVLLCAAGVLLAFLVPTTRTLLVSVADPAYASNRTRLEILIGSLAKISNRGAILGEGLGDTASLLGRPADISFYEIVAADARVAQRAKAQTFLDNAVAKTGVEQGVIGLVLAGWAAVRLFLAAVRRARPSELPEVQVVGLAMSAIIVGLATMWFFLDVPDIFPVNLYFWTFAGIVAASPVILKERERRRIHFAGGFFASLRMTC